jgi:hypothetical protein
MENPVDKWWEQERDVEREPDWVINQLFALVDTLAAIGQGCSVKLSSRKCRHPATASAEEQEWRTSDNSDSQDSFRRQFSSTLVG